LVTARNRLLVEIDKELAPLDLTGAQCGVMFGLATGQAATPADLCDLLDYDRGAMTRLLNRMEDKGILVRRPNPQDRRGLTLELTEKGRGLYPLAMAKIEAVYAKALANLEPDQAKTLVSLLCRVVGNLA
jgi:DNA-binding MarR family transcriptional regulator